MYYVYIEPYYSSLSINHFVYNLEFYKLSFNNDVVLYKYDFKIVKND